MITTVETEVVRAHTRLDGVDARLKRMERKLDKMTWIVASVSGVAAVLGPMIAQWLTK
jgi:hypothetical protein